jgi:hypothetical protein
MDKTTEIGLIVLAVLGIVAWIGGGRKWAFRALLAALVLLGIGAAGLLLYSYWADRDAARRAQKVHECAVAKVANPKCTEAPEDSLFPKGSLICPLYTLSDNSTPQQEQEAVATAEQECRGEMNLREKSLHEQISQYKQEHGIAETSSKLGTKECAAKVRSFYPHVYDDLDDATLTKKLLAKYPDYCDTRVPGGWVEDVQGIR